MAHARAARSAANGKRQSHRGGCTSSPSLRRASCLTRQHPAAMMNFEADPSYTPLGRCVIHLASFIELPLAQSQSSGFDLPA